MGECGSTVSRDQDLMSPFDGHHQELASQNNRTTFIKMTPIELCNILEDQLKFNRHKEADREHAQTVIIDCAS